MGLCEGSCLDPVEKQHSDLHYFLTKSNQLECAYQAPWRTLRDVQWPKRCTQTTSQRARATTRGRIANLIRKRPAWTNVRVWWSEPALGSYRQFLWIWRSDSGDEEGDPDGEKCLATYVRSWCHATCTKQQDKTEPFSK